MKICFICTANICRSYVSEMLLKHYSGVNGVNPEIISRGIYAQNHFKVPQKIIVYLKSKNIEFDNHVSTLVSKEDIESSDTVLVMEHSHYDFLTNKYSQFSDKIHLLMDYVYNEDKEVEDPVGETGKSFIKHMDMLDKTIKTLNLKLNCYP